MKSTVETHYIWRHSEGFDLHLGSDCTVRLAKVDFVERGKEISMQVTVYDFWNRPTHRIGLYEFLGRALTVQEGLRYSGCNEQTGTIIFVILVPCKSRKDVDSAVITFFERLTSLFGRPSALYSGAAGSFEVFRKTFVQCYRIDLQKMEELSYGAYMQLKYRGLVGKEPALAREREDLRPFVPKEATEKIPAIAQRLPVYFYSKKFYFSRRPFLAAGE